MSMSSCLPFANLKLIFRGWMNPKLTKSSRGERSLDGGEKSFGNHTTPALPTV